MLKKITKNDEKWWFFKICQKGEMLKNVGEKLFKMVINVKKNY